LTRKRIDSGGVSSLERSDGPKENITKKIDVEAPAQTIENITELIPNLWRAKLDRFRMRLR
jgi:hypothetical protein